MQSATRPSPYRIQVLDRAVAVLDVLAKNQQRGLTLPEVARAVGVAKSTAHRLLNSLQEKRFIFKKPANERYILGLRLFELGAIAGPESGLRDRARPYLEHLAAATGESIHLAILEQGRVLHLDKIESTRPLRISIVLGSYSPASTTALGKALLAYLPEEQLREVVRLHGLPRRTANSITTLTALQDDLRLVRERGYAVDSEEDQEGLRCVGAPVQDSTGAAIAAVSVSGPSIRLTTERIPHIARLVVGTTRALAKELGADGCRTRRAKKGGVLGFQRDGFSASHRAESLDHGVDSLGRAAMEKGCRS